CWGLVEEFVTYRLNQMCLADTRCAVNVERIVKTARRLRDRHGCGMRHSIAGPDDERFQAVVAIEAKEGGLVRTFVGVRAIELVKTGADEVAGRNLGRFGESLPAIAPQISHLLNLRRCDEQFTAFAVAELQFGKPASRQSRKAVQDVPMDLLGDRSPRCALRHRSSTPLRSSQVIQAQNNSINIMCDIRLS